MLCQLNNLFCLSDTCLHSLPYVLFQLFITMLLHTKITALSLNLNYALFKCNLQNRICVVLIIQNLKIAVQRSRSFLTVVNAFLSLKSRNLLKFILKFPEGY